MKLKYLGTAAAEGIPGMFCNCRVCRNALKIREPFGDVHFLAPFYDFVINGILL